MVVNLNMSHYLKYTSHMNKVLQMNQKKRKKRVWVFFLTPLVYEKNIFHSFLWKGSQEYFIKVFKSIVSEFAT